jgi:hypothetical protein
MPYRARAGRQGLFSFHAAARRDVRSDGKGQNRPGAECRRRYAPAHLAKEAIFEVEFVCFVACRNRSQPPEPSLAASPLHPERRNGFRTRITRHPIDALLIHKARHDSNINPVDVELAIE